MGEGVGGVRSPGAAQAIPAVVDQHRVVGDLPRHSVNNGQIPAQNRMLGELPLQLPLRRQCTGEHHQPGGLLVEPLDGAEAGIVRHAAARFQTADGHAGPGLERVAVRPLERDGQQAGRLADHGHLGVQVDEQLALAARLRAAGAHLDPLSLSQPLRRIGGGPALHPHLAAPDELAGLAPREARD